MANEKILVIDDDKNILSMVSRILTGTECELLNPQEKDILAHEIFKHDCSLDDAPCKKYKRIFSDFNYQMPGLNGLMVLKLIRAVPCLGQKINLVLATAGFPNGVVED
jgi:CheY-like chemotaxis protein